MSGRAATLDVGRLIDEAPISGYQVLVAAMCSLVVFFDGFDTQIVAFIAPSISAEFHLTRADLGPLFVASLVGILFGAAVFGPMADRFGRRRIILACTFSFAVLTLASASATSLLPLLVLRFLTGLGLGGAMPNAIALTAEFVPHRRRATFVLIMFTGFPAGAAVSGLLAGWLVPTEGWRAVLLVGGALPLLLSGLLVVWLPESVRFLVLSRAAPERIARVIGRLLPRSGPVAAAGYTVHEPPGRGIPVGQLFRARAPAATLLLWVVFFVNLLSNFTLQNWIPILATDSGIALQQAVFTGSLYQIGSVAGALTLGLAMDRLGPFRVVPLLLGLAVPFIAALGLVSPTLGMLMTLSFAAGVCVSGGQGCANALAAMFYPTAVRATGVGWALGVGRIGAIIGPVVVGRLLSEHWSYATLFGLLAGTQAVAALACIAMSVVARRDGRMEEPAALASRA